ncbi:hypothetical protein EJ03DRAFT_337608 [Teratosphaeria nubilosa]|uniref:DUF7730 domain-containing protein n=1 Tax=Teratosphaeria nubilosa TaxID=161662 RepID=A0A6G1L4K6_9PEZI|nr:hypothetical protein EJ03DRAFT_337608 [Teratosphaeria nubilosa]
MDKDAVSVSKSTFELATHAKDQLQLNIFRNNANLVKQHESIPLPGRPHNKDSFDFEALPPELRNQIYSHVLTLPPGSHFRFSRFSGRTRRTQNKPVSCPFETSATIRVLNKRKTRGVREHSMKSVAPSQAVNACLLLTNRTVHQEATPILYGSNRFVFQSALTAGDFFAWVGDQYKAMRDIEVMQYGTALHGTLLTQTLSRLAHIQNLNIVLYSDDNLKALCSQVRAVVRGGVQAACDCARAGGHCACQSYLGRPDRRAIG